MKLSKIHTEIAKQVFGYTLVILASLFIIFARRPDAISNPQFWAEDGARWYADAYKYRESSPLLPHIIPYAGYIQTLSRIVASIAMLFPLEHGPLVLNVASILIQLVPIIVIVCDPRSKKFFLGRMHMFVFVLAYLFVPNTIEIHGNITNAHWYLAFASLLTILKPASKSKLVNMLDVLLVTLSCFSGPFALFLLPIMIFNYLRREKSHRNLRFLMICAISSIVQLFFLFSTGLGRTRLPQTFSLFDLYEIVYKQVIWGAIAGPFGIGWISAKSAYASVFLFVTTLLGLGLSVYSFVRGSYVLKCITFYAASIFVISVLIPTATPTTDRSVWAILANTDGLRYWLIPMLAFLYITTTAMLSKKGAIAAKFIAIFFLSIMVFFVIRYARDNRGIHYPAFPDMKYRAFVKQFESNPTLEKISIPINPKGWQMILIR